MLRFFSKIRLKLAVENKPVKYMRYAVGEIVLVVIGILIALQVNNWNEYKKDRTLESKILKEIRTNLNDDLREIGSDISAKDSVIQASKNIINILETQDNVSDALFYDVAKMQVNTHFDPNKSGYELLISKGVEIVRNDSLRKSLSYLYESGYSYYYRYEEELSLFKTHHIYPQLLEKFDWIYKPELMFTGHHHISKQDFLKLKKDYSFFRLINAIGYQNELVKNRAERIQKRIQELIYQIDKELN